MYTALYYQIFVVQIFFKHLRKILAWINLKILFKTKAKLEFKLPWRIIFLLLFLLPLTKVVFTNITRIKMSLFKWRVRVSLELNVFEELR